MVTGPWGSDNTASCKDLKVTVESEVYLLLIYCIPKEILRWIEVKTSPSHLSKAKKKTKNKIAFFSPRRCSYCQQRPSDVTA